MGQHPTRYPCGVLHWRRNHEPRRRAMRIVLVEDDRDLVEIMGEDLESFGLPKPSVFSEIQDAIDDPGSVDVCLIDLSAVAPIISGPAFMYSPIASYAERHPGAVILIASCVSKGFAMDVVERVQDCAPDSVVRFVDRVSTNPRENLRLALKATGILEKA